MVKIPPKRNSRSALLYGRFTSTDDMMEAITVLERDLTKAQKENRSLKERLGMPVSKFKYH
jgi:hypothetical protein